MRVSSRSGASRTGRQISNNALICIADRGVFCWYERRGYTRASTPIHEATVRRLPVPAASVHQGARSASGLQRIGCSDLAVLVVKTPPSVRISLGPAGTSWRPSGVMSRNDHTGLFPRCQAIPSRSDRERRFRDRIWCRRSGSGAGSRAKDDTIRHIVLTTAPPPSASGDAVVPHQSPGSCAGRAGCAATGVVATGVKPA